jgi:hypothetical protein
VTATPLSADASAEAETVTLPVALTAIDPVSAAEPPDAVIDTSPPFAFTEEPETEIEEPAANVTLVPAITAEPSDTVIDPLVAVNFTVPAVAVTGEDDATITEPPAVNNTP